MVIQKRRFISWETRARLKRFITEYGYLIAGSEKPARVARTVGGEHGEDEEERKKTDSRRYPWDGGGGAGWREERRLRGREIKRPVP